MLYVIYLADLVLQECLLFRTLVDETTAIPEASSARCFDLLGPIHVLPRNDIDVNLFLIIEDALICVEICFCHSCV